MTNPGSRDELGLGAQFLGLFVSPRATLQRVANEPHTRVGAAAVAVLAIAWAILLVMLWTAGHAPSVVLVPIQRDSYYAVQALSMMPVLTGLWWLSSQIAQRIAARAGGHGTNNGTRSALGLAYAAPMLVLHVLPEALAFAWGGFDAMAIVGRATLPIAALAVWALSAWTLRIAHGVRVPVAIAASFCGLLAQALVGGVWIR